MVGIFGRYEQGYPSLGIACLGEKSVRPELKLSAFPIEGVTTGRCGGDDKNFAIAKAVNEGVRIDSTGANPEPARWRATNGP